MSQLNKGTAIRQHERWNRNTALHYKSMDQEINIVGIDNYSMQTQCHDFKQTPLLGDKLNNVQ